jgi:hypothetical protein
MKLALGLVLVCASSVPAQKLNVKMIDRQFNEDRYDYVAVYKNIAVGKTFGVHGTTITLQLPDGRLAVVNCTSKFVESMDYHPSNRRSCRSPMVDNIEADFKGKNARLIWPVSLDGKKVQSETYKILGVVDKPKTEQN